MTMGSDDSGSRRGAPSDKREDAAAQLHGNEARGGEGGTAHLNDSGSGRDSRVPRNLTPDAIVQVALDIMVAYGLGDLSMRRLASTLGVQPSALYWHFASKQDLLAAVAAVVLADLPAVAADDWAADLERWAVGLDAALRRWRGGAEVVSAVLALSSWEAGPGAAVERSLAAAGLSDDQAHAAVAGLLYFVLGQAFDQEQRLQASALGVISAEPAEAAAATAEVELVVSLMVQGLRLS